MQLVGSQPCCLGRILVVALQEVVVQVQDRPVVFFTVSGFLILVSCCTFDRVFASALLLRCRLKTAHANVNKIQCLMVFQGYPVRV